MGTYNISVEEFLDGIIVDGERLNFEDFLYELEGDVSEGVVAEAWNKLAKKHKWNDKLEVKK